MRGPGPNIFETSEDNPLIEFRVGHADGAIATWGPMHFAVDYLANQGGALNGVTVFVETGRTEAPWLWPDEWMEQGVPLELPAEDSAEFEQAIAAAEADIAARTFTMEVWITDACGTALHNSKSIRLDASTIEAWP